MRSRAQLDYAGVQQAFDEGTAPEAVRALPAAGRARLALARRRHAIDLGLPEQIVEPSPADGWTVELRRPLPVEAYNAEISLLTGMRAAVLMLDAGVGILRTVPPADPRTVTSLHRAARALGIP